MKHLVDVPKELFRIFSEKYGAGESREETIDRTKYLIQPLNLQTNAWHAYKPWRDEGRSVVTIGLFQSGTPERMDEVARLMVWNHIPQVVGVESMSIWSGIHGIGHTRTERVVVRLGNGLDPFDPIVPEADFVAEVIAIAHRIGKHLKARKYCWHENIGFVPANEYQYA